MNFWTLFPSCLSLQVFGLKLCINLLSRPTNALDNKLYKIHSTYIKIVYQLFVFFPLPVKLSVILYVLL